MATSQAAARRLAAHEPNPAIGRSMDAVKFAPRRGLAGAADYHGPPKVNIWEDPMSPSKRKEEHFVIASLTGWDLLIHGGYKMFSGGKKDKKDEKLAEASH